MTWKARSVVLAALVLAMLLSVVAPALATVPPGQIEGWEPVSVQFRPQGNANGWIFDGMFNPPGNHTGWVQCSQWQPK